MHWICCSVANKQARKVKFIKFDMALAHAFDTDLRSKHVQVLEVRSLSIECFVWSCLRETMHLTIVEVHGMEEGGGPADVLERGTIH